MVMVPIVAPGLACKVYWSLSGLLFLVIARGNVKTDVSSLPLSLFADITD